MRPKLWSLNALSIELHLDRRTVAARLRDVPPDGKVRGHDAWRLETALPVLQGRPALTPTGEIQQVMAELGAPFTIRGRPVDEAVCMAALTMAERIPMRAAAIAVWEGVPLETAKRIYANMAVAAAMLVDQIAVEAGISWRRGDDHHAMPTEPDWAALALEVPQ